MKNKRIPSRLFLLALFITILVLSSMLIKPFTTMVKGEEVMLATMPLDPRDLFKGDYVILDLDIEVIDAIYLSKDLRKQIEDKDNYYDDKIPVYVSLVKGKDDIYEAIAVSSKKPHGIYVEGKMDAYISDNSSEEDAEFKEIVRVDYGINRYYVEEGTGLELEKQAREGQVLLSAKIYNGYAILTDIKGVK